VVPGRNPNGHQTVTVKQRTVSLSQYLQKKGFLQSTRKSNNSRGVAKTLRILGVHSFRTMRVSVKKKLGGDSKRAQTLGGGLKKLFLTGEN